MKFTFKKDKPTGRYSSFYDTHVRIKFKRKVVGEVVDRSPYTIRLMVVKPPTSFDPAPFKWISLQRKFETLDECLEFLQDNTDKIRSQFELHEQDA